MSKVWVYTICKDEAQMMPFFLRHYSTFAERIIAYDERSTDGTRETLRANPKVELREWPHSGLDDEKFLHAINTVPLEAAGHADWVIFADVDELLYHPDILNVLDSAQEDMIASTGYALISTNGFPKDGTQIYEQVKTGYPQPNYDKFICWRAGLRVLHTIGRHTYPGDFPKCNGKLGQIPKLKLLHCHHVGGAEYTEALNRRNYNRAVNKRYAWNYTEAHNTTTQVGSVAWVKSLIDRNLLSNVVSEHPVKVQFCCGSNRLPGWDNRDAETDIRKPLPFANQSVIRIFVEHGLEHVTHKEAWNFIQECHRILMPRGIVRIAIPDITRMWEKMTPEYQKAVRNGGHGDGSAKSCIKAAIFEHGHQAAWNDQLLTTMLQAIGFQTLSESIGESTDPELRGIERHGDVVGASVAAVETSIVEGIKT